MKPYVILNAAMTLDGKIATKTGSSKISGIKDLERVHKLRKEVDGIMVGINTVIADDPRLTIHKIPSKNEDNPIRVVVDSKARTPRNSRILSSDAPTIIAISNSVKNEPKSKEDSNYLKKVANVFYSGNEQVDLKDLMSYLYDNGIETLMLEGGSTLNFSMIKEGLIDEIKIAIAPMIVGGRLSKTLFDGNGFDYMEEAIRLDFENSYFLGKDLIIEYKVNYNK